MSNVRTTRLEYLLTMGSSSHEDSTGNSMIEAVFQKGWKPVPTIKFDWSKLPSILRDLAMYDLSIMTFDDRPHHLRSIEIDYEKNRIRFHVGEAVTATDEESFL